jgi:hypothetical protein
MMMMIGFGSMLGSLFVATTIFYSKKLQAHPQRLIAYTCLCEAVSAFNGLAWTIDVKRYICYLDLHQLFSWTVYFRIGDQIKYNQALDVL